MTDASRGLAKTVALQCQHDVIEDCRITCRRYHDGGNECPPIAGITDPTRQRSWSRDLAGAVVIQGTGPQPDTRLRASAGGEIQIEIPTGSSYLYFDANDLAEAIAAVRADLRAQEEG